MSMAMYQIKFVMWGDSLPSLSGFHEVFPYAKIGIKMESVNKGIVTITTDYIVGEGDIRTKFPDIHTRVLKSVSYITTAEEAAGLKGDENV